MSLLARIRQRLFPPPPPCQHAKATTRLWNDPNGTPMQDWRCPDCGECDRGHVYGEPWTEEEIKACR